MWQKQNRRGKVSDGKCGRNRTGEEKIEYIQNRKGKIAAKIVQERKS